MDAPLSAYWTVEYNFIQDAFHVGKLPDYLSHTQKAFTEVRYFGSVILALHPTQSGASDECAMWQDRRNARPDTTLRRLQEIQRHVKGLESQAE
jgi:hypothetical protein